MIDITHKHTTLRTATAQAIVKVSNPETIEAIQNKAVPKGDVFEMAKAAGLLGVKKTPDLLPDCHPLPIEQASIEYSIEGLEITILMHVKTIYKTGVEVEAMLCFCGRTYYLRHAKTDRQRRGNSSYQAA
jgi:molybdenum cofactor biosynthesis protein MoaC